MPGEECRRHKSGEEGRGQRYDDGPLDTVRRPPQLVPAEKQPPQARQRAARSAGWTSHDYHLVPSPGGSGVALAS